MLELKIYVDPGHGWVEVKKELLKELGISKQISNYSYKKGSMCYLEEDCDMPILFDALRKNGIKFKEVEIYEEETPIRGYERYVA